MKDNYKADVSHTDEFDRMYQEMVKQAEDKYKVKPVYQPKKEGLVEEEEIEFTTEDKYWCDIMSESDPTTYILPQGYIFKDENGNVINTTKIVLEKKTNKDMNEKVDMGEVSDGYHTFNELYEYRMLYNAALFNEFAKQGLYDVHKSRKHSDGKYPFGDSNWFIVMAELPTGQISNHYEMKDWDKFQIPEKLLANKWDMHSPRDVAERLTSFANPKKEYPKTYKECLKVLGIEGGRLMLYNGDITQYERELYIKINNLSKLLICRDAYWKIAGDEMGLGKPWEPDYSGTFENGTPIKYVIYNIGTHIVKERKSSPNHILSFPTEEMRDAFYENFKKEIEECKELL